MLNFKYPWYKVNKKIYNIDWMYIQLTAELESIKRYSFIPKLKTERLEKTGT